MRKLFNVKLSKKKLTLIILLFVIAIYGVLVAFPKPQGHEGENPFIREEGEQPMLIAHGGGNHEFPDNTLEAYYNAYSADQDVMMETDVSLTKDGVIILSHDTTLDRKTNLVDAPIIETNYEDLMEDEVDFGYENPIDGPNGTNTTGTFTKYTNYQNEQVSPTDVNYPEGVDARHEDVFLATTLEELIKAFPDNPINVEIKQKGETGQEALEETLDLLETLDEEYDTFSRIVLASFHEDIYETIKRKASENETLMFSPQESAIRNFVILQRSRLNVFFTEPVSVFQLPTTQQGILFADESFIKSAHDHNIAVHFWTINDQETMRMLVNVGADGIMTDRPHLLKGVLDAYEEIE
ncbi:MAG: glycerophosphodiester phosphodiesterase family protein [Bacillota bacterium]